MVLVKLLSDPSKLSGFEGSDRDAGAGPLAPPAIFSAQPCGR